MAIDFTRVASQTNTSPSSNEDLPAAKYWLNIGYSVTVTMDDNSTENRFISLAQGIPVDTLKDLETKRGSAAFLAMNTARNELRDELVSAFSAMEPGDEQTFPIEGTSLELQVRRVREDAAPISAKDNPFARKAPLFAAAKAEAE